jgi:hypothetical protein
MQLEQLHPDCWFQISGEFDLWDTNQTLMLLRVSKQFTECVAPTIKNWLNDIAKKVKAGENIAIVECIRQHSSKRDFAGISEFLRSAANLSEAVYYVHHILTYVKELQKYEFNRNAWNHLPVSEFDERGTLLTIDKNDKLSFLDDSIKRQGKTIGSLYDLLPKGIHIIFLIHKQTNLCLNDLNAHYRLTYGITDFLNAYPPCQKI